jgi:hypothetical protein
VKPAAAEDLVPDLAEAVADFGVISRVLGRLSGAPTNSARRSGDVAAGRVKIVALPRVTRR